MRYYPAFLDLRGRTCLVVGEDPLAEEKASALRRAGAIVEKQAEWDAGQARKVFLIVAAVEDRPRVEEIARFAERNRILLNVVDQPKYCHFILPALLQQGDLLIAISTSGKSPALASLIRKQLERQFGSEYATLLQVLGEVRPLVQNRLKKFEDRRDFYRQLVAGNLVETMQQAGEEGVWDRIRKSLEEWS